MKGSLNLEAYTTPCCGSFWATKAPDWIHEKLRMMDGPWLIHAADVHARERIVLPSRVSIPYYISDALPRPLNVWRRKQLIIITVQYVVQFPIVLSQTATLSTYLSTKRACDRGSSAIRRPSSDRSTPPACGKSPKANRSMRSGSAA